MGVFFSSLLCIIFLCNIRYAVSTRSNVNYGIQELADRFVLLEQKFENHRDISESYSNKILYFKNRLKKLEDKLIQRETHLGDTNNCESRIQSLENTVQELSKLVKKQNDYTYHIKKLETIIMNQEKALSQFKKEVLQKKIYANVFPDKHDAKQGKNLKYEETKAITQAVYPLSEAQTPDVIFRNLFFIEV